MRSVNPTGVSQQTNLIVFGLLILFAVNPKRLAPTE